MDDVPTATTTEPTWMHNASSMGLIGGETFSNNSVSPFGDSGDMQLTISHGTETPTGTQIKMRRTANISPKLYFRFVKSKLTKTQVEALKKRTKKLQAMIKDVDELGQQALYEHLMATLAVTLREMEAQVAGIQYHVDKKLIDKFIHKVKDRTVKFSKLEAFPRTIPTKPKRKIKAIQDKKLFDEIWILYVDYTGQNLKTNKEKIREKDPIAFGKYAYQDDRYYFITDWVDEYCDLTFDTFIKRAKITNPDFSVGKIPEMTDELAKEIKAEVLKRHERLKTTGLRNYVGNMADEDRDNAKRKKKGLRALLSFWK